MLTEESDTAAQRVGALAVFYAHLQPKYPALSVYACKRLNTRVLQACQPASVILNPKPDDEAEAEFFLYVKELPRLVRITVVPARRELGFFLNSRDAKTWTPLTFNDIDNTKAMLYVMAWCTVTAGIPCGAFNAIPLAVAAMHKIRRKMLSMRSGVPSQRHFTLEQVAGIFLGLDPEKTAHKEEEEKEDVDDSANALRCKDTEVLKARVRFLFQKLEVRKVRCNALSAELEKLKKIKKRF